jgi:hypothetical protein
MSIKETRNGERQRFIQCGNVAKNRERGSVTPVCLRDIDLSFRLIEEELGQLPKRYA